MKNKDLIILALLAFVVFVSLKSSVQDVGKVKEEPIQEISKQFDRRSATDSVTKRNNQTATMADTQMPSSWETYRNEEFGFTAPYPSGWEVDESSLTFDVVAV